MISLTCSSPSFWLGHRTIRHVCTTYSPVKKWRESGKRGVLSNWVHFYKNLHIMAIRLQWFHGRHSGCLFCHYKGFDHCHSCSSTSTTPRNSATITKVQCLFDFCWYIICVSLQLPGNIIKKQLSHAILLIYAVDLHETWYVPQVSLLLYSEFNSVFVFVSADGTRKMKTVFLHYTFFSL